MTNKLNISVLVAARDEYIDQLKCILVPLFIQGFTSVYQDAIKLSGNKRVIWTFQGLLKQIRTWNQTILQEESRRIKKKCPYIMDIVTAIFVTNVKILASVRLKGSREDIRVKIPTSDIFVHAIYIEAAHQLFNNPFLCYHKLQPHEQHKNKEYIKCIIESSIDETIRQLLPFEDILQKYLSDALNENAEFGGGESSSDDETVSDDNERSIDNNDLPSDEESEPESEDYEQNVKKFNLNGSNFKSNESDSEPESDSDSDNEGLNSQISHFNNNLNVPFKPPVNTFFNNNTIPQQPQPVQVPPPQQPQQSQEYSPPPQQGPPPQQPQQSQEYSPPPQEHQRHSFF